jgi:hypothetical protein
LLDVVPPLESNRNGMPLGPVPVLSTSRWRE